jgi:ribosomal protein L35
MPKLKTRKAASKRYKITGSDKFYVVTLIKVTMKKSNRQNENYLKKSVLMIEIIYQINVTLLINITNINQNG